MGTSRQKIRRVRVSIKRNTNGRRKNNRRKRR